MRTSWRRSANDSGRTGINRQKASPATEFLFHFFTKFALVLHDPWRQGTGGELPAVFLFMHPEKDPFAPFITHIYSELFGFRAPKFPEIEFTHSVPCFYQQRELDHSAKFQMHTNQVEADQLQLLC